MPIERKMIVKQYLLLCEGKDAEQFLIKYLNSDVLSEDQRFSNDIQIFDFGGNTDLSSFLMNLKNMDKFDQVTSLAILRDAENDFVKACKEVDSSLKKSGFMPPKHHGTWSNDDSGLRVGFMLFPLDNSAGTLEDLCLKILSEKDNKSILTVINAFLNKMESSFERNYRRKHKNKLHTYLSSSDKYVSLPIGIASSAGAFDWGSNELEPLKEFLAEGFKK